MEKQSTNRSVDRAFDVIEAFTFKDTELSQLEIVERTKLPLATVHRLVKTLSNRGYLDQVKQTGKYRLGMQFVKLGGIVIQNINIIKIATPHLQDLAKKTELNVNLSVYDNGDALCLINIESFHNFGHEILTGQRLPIYAGALSKVILAYLPERENVLERMTMFSEEKRKTLLSELEVIKTRGYANSIGELSVGAVAYAVPIYNYENKMVAGIALTGPEHFLINEKSDYMLRYLQEAASEISKELGYHQVY